MTSRIIDLEENLPNSSISLVRSARCWAERKLEPVVTRHWEEGTFPSDTFLSFRENCPHLLGFNLPKEYNGGEHEYDLMEQCHIYRTFASVDASFATALLLQYGSCKSILLCGTEEQKRRFLPPLAQLHDTACFCLTEPQSGSDASNLRTIAIKVPGGYHITGSKRWIGNAISSEVFIVWARNTSLPGSPVMGFIVQRSHQKCSTTIETTKIQGVFSLRMVPCANVEFRNAFCPDFNAMSGFIGFGDSVRRVLEASRVYVAWIPVGMCQGALETTIRQVQDRDAFGSTIGSNQLVQERLVRATAMVVSMYLLVERVTKDFMEGRCSLPATSMVKAFNSRVARDVIAICREALGGNGLVLDYGIASKFCDIEGVHTYEGTYDICTLVCGRALTGTPAIRSAASTAKKRKSKL